MKRIYYLFIFIIVLVGCSSYRIGFDKTLKIGTASFSGAYYPTGGALSKLINDHSSEDFSKVISTGGSADNINRLLKGKIHIALAQADRHYEAYYGMGEWKGKKPAKKLRSLFSLYPQTINLIAARVSGIKTIKDLKGRRVNLGNPGSGGRANAKDVLKAARVKLSEISSHDYTISIASKKFLEGKLDAFFYTIGHPSLVISEASNVQGGASVIPITDVDTFLIKYPYYQSTLVPMKRYPSMLNSKERVDSIGIQTTLLTTEDVPEGIIYKVVKIIFENMEEFKSQHAVLRDLDPKEMLQGLTAPLHPGAERYFRESGLLNEFDPVKRIFGN
ncbi:MAG: TAXI family TRAP transporter solute-binding subunit [Bacteriovoracaceae bacterium]|nr:TAXI family TRAP transporter solute-binding subunit [Bacteriovoracaceae bacterium]